MGCDETASPLDNLGLESLNINFEYAHLAQRILFTQSIKGQTRHLDGVRVGRHGAADFGPSVAQTGLIRRVAHLKLVVHFPDCDRYQANAPLPVECECGSGALYRAGNRFDCNDGVVAFAKFFFKCQG